MKSKFSPALIITIRSLVLFMQLVLWGLSPIYAQNNNDISLHDLCDYFDQKAQNAFEKGDYTKAIAFVESAIEITREFSDSLDYEYARRRSNLAYYNYCLGDFDKAISIESEAYLIRMKYENTRPYDFAISLFHLCDYHGDKGNYDDAIRFGEQAVKLLKDNPEVQDLYLDALASLACNSIYAGNTSLAKETIETGLSICTKYNKIESHIGALLLTHQGMLFMTLGDYYSARKYTEKGRDIFIKTVGAQHPHYAYALNNLGVIYYNIGDYPSAIDALTECLEVRKNVFGIGHQYYIRALANLGSLNEFIGNTEIAFRLTNQAIVLDELQLGRNSLEYCYELGDVARQNDLLGKYKEAIELQSQVVNLEKNIIGTNHYMYALDLLNLAKYLSHAKDIEKAKQIANEGLEIMMSVMGEDNYYNSRFYRALSDFSLACGDLDDAYNQINKALNTIEKYNGNNTIAYSEAILEKIVINERKGKINVGDLESYNEFLRGTIVHSFANMSSFERGRFWQGNKDWFTNKFPNYALSVQNDTLNQILFNNILLTKGITLNAGIELNKQIFSSGNEEIMKDYTELSQTNQQINTLLRMPITERYASVDSLMGRRENLEKRLLNRSKAYGNYMKTMETTWMDIKTSLKSSEIAIEFFTIPVIGDVLYCALIVTPDCSSPKFEVLFSSSSLNNISKTTYYTSNELYDLVWQPLEKYCDGIKTIYFAPTEALHNIAIEYVIVNNGNKRINDYYTIYRVSTTREIIKKENHSYNQSIVLFGGIQYDSKEQSGVMGTERNSAYHIEKDSLRSGFSYLPATKNECQSISNLMSKKYDTSFYSGIEASESQFKELSGKNIGIIHIATHGFYWTDEDISRSHKEYDFLFNTRDSQISSEQVSMSHSGLLFSGANNSLKRGTVFYSGDDGILTSNEIVNLNLSSIGLLVMSACQTGLGDINSDEVFGLQRGFKAAGVRTVVMSLWEVDDNATGLLMRKFYEYYGKNYSASESLQKAQHFLMQFKGVISINGERIRVDYSDPKYWAAFIVLDGTPLVLDN